jgi:hypothetical protein
MYQRQYMNIINHDRRLLTRPPVRPPVKGFSAPLPREAGKETLFWGLRRSCFRVWLLSLFLRELELLVEVAAPSTSISSKSKLALDSHSTSLEEAGQRQV